MNKMNVLLIKYIDAIRTHDNSEESLKQIQRYLLDMKIRYNSIQEDHISMLNERDLGIDQTLDLIVTLQEAYRK